MISNSSNWPGFILLILFAIACSDDAVNQVPSPPTKPPHAVPFNIDDIADTYPALTSFDSRFKWGPYNVHDPSIIKDGDYFYCYSTDAGYGITVPPGIQIRKSKDLVEWQFSGFVFASLPELGSDYITTSGGTPFNSLWAPYVLKVGSEFRLYYSLSCAKPRLSVIGLATASNPLGPWVEKGLVVVSRDDNSVQTNAIDPTVIVTSAGEHWMYYGSAWDGIYVLKLNATTGMAASEGDKGSRIAQRGFTGNVINGNIEGPEIIYHPELNKYFLFIAYDWLETKYNVRVGRADAPQGPFLDFNGKNLNEEEDNTPMILAPYKFSDHGGWQGTSHPTIFQNEGQYYIGHQGRPGVDKYYMVLHIRKLFWMQDGWPIVSPERYAATEQTPVKKEELTGTWEKIKLEYTVTPGFGEQQIVPNFQEAIYLTLDASGTVDDNAENTWTYDPPWLQFNFGQGPIEKVFVERGRDWENKKACLIFTGLNDKGIAVWGKKTIY